MKLTIGIPFYNARLYLVETLQSVFAQSLQDWELILVDDAPNVGVSCKVHPALSLHDARRSLVHVSRGGSRVL